MLLLYSTLILYGHSIVAAMSFPTYNSREMDDIPKRAAYSYVSEFKRLPVYNFGLGKRTMTANESPCEPKPRSPNTYEDTLEDLLESYRKRGGTSRYAFGLGKKSASKTYSFGLGKRNYDYDYALEETQPHLRLKKRACDPNSDDDKNQSCD